MNWAARRKAVSGQFVAPGLDPRRSAAPRGDRPHIGGVRRRLPRRPPPRARNPAVLEITGVPQAIASTGGSPNPSIKEGAART